MPSVVPPPFTPSASERELQGAEAGPARAEAGPGGPEPLAPGADPRAPPTRARIADRWLMFTLIPAFGLMIPHSTGLFGALGPGDPAFWWGHLWFLAGAAGIYLANRALLFEGRKHTTWFSRPAARLTILGTGILFGTVPTTAVMLHFWSALSGVPLGDSVRVVPLINVICVLFVTWLYETLFLIQERVDDQVRVERLAAARTQAELDALRSQVDPHFLFNALNTLAGLLETRPQEARRFLDHLARVYRALLDTRGRSLVPLDEELELAGAYGALLHIRFGDALVVRLEAPADADAWLIPPGAVQLLIENAVRHNAVDPGAPLVITVGVADGALTVAHPRRPRPARPGAGVGLSNLDARALATIGRGLNVREGEDFVVLVPLRAVGSGGGQA